MDNEIRINKYISMSGYCSRRAADALVEEGRVTVDGVIATAGTKVQAGGQVKIDGVEIRPVEDKTIYAFYKPVGYISSLSDEQGEGIAKFIPEGMRLFPVGRLDKESEGLMLLTNDGEFANRLMHPSHEVDKVYKVLVTGYSDENLLRLGQPIELDGYKIKKPHVRLLRTMGPNSGKAQLLVTIHEGRNRQVRRMCSAAGMEVQRLTRVQEGSLRLGTLPSGKWRHLSAQEVQELCK